MHKDQKIMYNLQEYRRKCTRKKYPGAGIKESSDSR